MDSTEPDTTPFAAVSAQTSKFTRVCTMHGPLRRPARLADLLTSSTNPTSINQRLMSPTAGLSAAPSLSLSFSVSSWLRAGTSVCLFHRLQIRSLRWGDPMRYPPFAKFQLTALRPVCYTLGIYLLNQFLAFLQPKFDPSLTQDEGLEDGEALPTKHDEEFRPFIRRLPEFKFWHSSTRAIAIAFFCTWWQLFNVPVFWPVLVAYFFILFGLTSKFCFQNAVSVRMGSGS